MMNLSDETKKLVNDYITKFNEYPRGWDFKNESLSEYKEYLKKKLQE